MSGVGSRQRSCVEGLLGTGERIFQDVGRIDHLAQHVEMSDLAIIQDVREMVDYDKKNY